MSLWDVDLGIEGEEFACTVGRLTLLGREVESMDSFDALLWKEFL